MIFLFNFYCVNFRCVDKLYMFSNFVVWCEYIYIGCEYLLWVIFFIDKVIGEFYIDDNVESNDEIV